MAWGIVGQERSTELLERWLATDRLPQSLLLTGPRGVGKRSLALALAGAINCTAGATPPFSLPAREGGAPCGECRACRLSADGGYPDVHLIQLREGRQKIGIRDVQQLQAELARRPSEGWRRVAVIADAERLSADAENCLLKTLEEPPPQAVIVLTAEEAEALLPTTVSRCRQLRLRPVPVAAIVEHLVGRLGLAEDQARLLAALAEGRPGRAIAAASEPDRIETYRAALERLRRAVDGSKLTRLEIARGLAESWSGKSEQVREELAVWVRWWRDLLLLNAGLGDHVVHVDRPDELRRQAERFSTAELRAALATLAQARADLDQNVNPRLALDVALLKLPAPSASA